MVRAISPLFEFLFEFFSLHIKIIYNNLHYHLYKKIYINKKFPPIQRLLKYCITKHVLFFTYNRNNTIIALLIKNNKRCIPVTRNFSPRNGTLVWTFWPVTDSKIFHRELRCKSRESEYEVLPTASKIPMLVTVYSRN